MVRPDRMSSSSAGNPGATAGSAAEGSPPLYPPLLIAEPHVNDKKRAVIGRVIEYKRLIDSTRARYGGTDLEFTGLFQLPDFGPPKANFDKAKAKIKVTKVKPLEKIGDDAEKDPDTEDEDKPAATTDGKADDDEDADVEAKASEDDEDDENLAAKSDSDIDDYTAAAGFDDDDANFEEAGGDADNDANTF